MFNMLMAEANNNWILLVVMGVLIVALLGGSFIMQKRNKKKADETKSSLKVGDIIITIGGIKGEIVSLNSDETFDLKTGNNAIITFFKGAIQTVNPQLQQVQAVAPKVKEKETEDPIDQKAEESSSDDESIGH